MDESRGWLPGDLVLIPGPRLASAVAGADRSAVSDQDLVRLAQARLKLVAHLQAQLLADIHEMGQRVDAQLSPDERKDPDPRHWAEVEIATALTWTKRTAGWQLAFAGDLLDRLPAVYAALERGDVDVPKAIVLVSETCSLEQATARRVVDQILSEAPRLTTGQLRARLRRLVIAADPDAARKDVTEQVKHRRVVGRLTESGTGELAGFDLPPERVAAAMERITAIARAAKSAGDGRRLPELRADAMLDLLVGDGVAAGGPITRPALAEDEPYPHPQPRPAPPGEAQDDDTVDPDQAEVAALWSAGFDRLPTQRPCPTCGTTTVKGPMPGPRKGVIDLQVSLTTLMGLTNLPADLAGFGPVIADIARQVAAQQQDATWPVLRLRSTRPPGPPRHHQTPTARRGPRLHPSQGQNLPGTRLPQSRPLLRHRPYARLGMQQGQPSM